MSVNNKINSFYAIYLNKYLNSVQYTFEKGNHTTVKVVTALNNIPELKSKWLIRITFLLLFLVFIIFLTSCQMGDQYRNRVGYTPLPKGQASNSLAPQPSFNGNKRFDKGQEQLYLKREQINIKQKEIGSSSGSIWADSAAPKNLMTEFKPSKPGDFVTVQIPENLQYKPEQNAQANNAAGANSNQQAEPVKSMKFEVVGMEPGGDVFLRGTKNYTSENGEQRNIVVMAKVPRRSINSSEINAKDLTEVAVNENLNGAPSNYSTVGWDQVVSRKIANYTPDLSAQITQLDGQKKEIETQKKALADQQKSLADEAERLKKDRKRLDSETARAKSILDAATSVGESSEPKTAAGAPKANSPAGSAAPPAASGGAQKP